MNKQIKSEIFSSFFKGLEELYNGQNQPYSFEIAELFINTLNKYDEAGVNVFREKDKPGIEIFDTFLLELGIGGRERNKIIEFLYKGAKGFLEQAEDKYYKIITRGVCSPPIAGGVIPSPAREVQWGYNPQKHDPIKM